MSAAQTMLRRILGEMCTQLVWEVTIVDALAPNSLNQGSFCNPGTTVTEAEASNSEKHCKLIDIGYIFQAVASEVQGCSGESVEIFSTRHCKLLCRSHQDRRAGSFLNQRISMALQIANAACVLGTVSGRDLIEEIPYKLSIYYINIYDIFETCISSQLFQKLVTTGRLG